MAERISTGQRIRTQHVAEREVMRYAHDHALWHKHVHNSELDAMQILKCIEMDGHDYTVDFSCRRTGKTVIKELYNLKALATRADQELGIVAPREAQSLTAMNYQLEAIRRSPILDNYLAHKAGRKRLSDTYYEFTNRSLARAYGIMAQVDGGDLTIASLEEVDDMPADRLYSRFLLMLGSSRRLGASKTSDNKPQIRITGVYKGADTLSEMVASGKYHALPTVDLYLGIEMGILQRSFMELMREQLAPDEYIRQLLCRNVAARNYIWTKWVRQAIQVGIAAKLELVEPMPGEQYRKRGLISIGYDHLGHGEDPNASKSALVVVEQIGNFLCFSYARTWPAGTDEKIIKDDLKALWRYFVPDVAIGDAYGIGMLTTLNDELFAENLTTVDRRAIGDGDSTATTWSEWAFAPIRFEGMVKHQMASAVRAAFSNKRAAMPYVDDRPVDDAVTGDMRRLQQQLTNIKAEATSKAYSSYKMVKRALGDDLFDAAMAAVWGLVTRGIGVIPTVVQSRKLTRQQLLGEAPMRLPSDPLSA
jgi:hypothetical protein